MACATKKRWSELSPAQRKAIVAAGVVQNGLLAAALIDIWRRPGSRINGPKRRWVVASFVNFFGPIAYFTLGRKR